MASACAHRARNVMTTREGESTGRRLLDVHAGGGAQALGAPIGALAPAIAPISCVLDRRPSRSRRPRAGDRWLDACVFTAGRAAVHSVIAAGATVVEDGRHRQRAAIEARYKRVMADLVAD